MDGTWWDRTKSVPLGAIHILHYFALRPNQPPTIQNIFYKHFTGLTTIAHHNIIKSPRY